MILLTETPPAGDTLNAMYERMPREGMVHSSLMCGEAYDMADDYNEAWACPAISWSAGGGETYRLASGDSFRVRSSGVVALAPGERYAYRADDASPFRSNMIVFPAMLSKRVSETVARSFDDVLEEPDGTGAKHSLHTQFYQPSKEAAELMAALAFACVHGHVNCAWYEEQFELLLGMLLSEQHELASAANNIDALKVKTRQELHRRVMRLMKFVLENYADEALDIGALAAEACLSRYHLIRVFKAMTGATPMEYLSTVRMDAASRLLRARDDAVKTVAADVGVPDRTAFYRQFRRRYGVSPSAYKHASKGL